MLPDGGVDFFEWKLKSIVKKISFVDKYGYLYYNNL